MAEAPFHRVILWSVKRADLSSELRAGFDAEGNLQVDGQDMGSRVEQFFGDDEYEYFITVRQSQMERLVAALAAVLAEPDPVGDAVAPFVTTSLKRIYSEPKAALHLTSSSELREWLKNNGIEAEFTTW